MGYEGAINTVTRIESSLYQCRLCGTINHSSAWNDIAHEHYEGAIVPIEKEEYDTCFICPGCFNEVSFNQRTFTASEEEVMITRERYNELVKIEALYKLMKENLG